MERLKVNIGKTYNLGNYESLRLEVGLEVDCDPASNEIFESCYRDIKEMLSKLETDNNVKRVGT